MQQFQTDRNEVERLAQLGAVLETSINEIYMFDETSLRFVHINQGACDNLGYDVAELLELTPVDIKPEFTRDTFEAAIKTLRTDEKQIIDFRTVHQRKDGSTYPVEVHVQRANYDSRPVFAAIILDITERTQTEEALAQSRLFLESAPDAMIIVNSSGDIEVANNETTKLFGYSHDELRGLSVDLLVPENFRDGHQAHRAAYRATPKVREMGNDLELFALTKDGGKIPIDVRLSPIATSDGTLIAASIRDISERKEAEKDLAEAKNLAEKATATKSRFLAAASHDLRQPLQSIGLYLSVLNRQPDKAAELSAKIRSSLDVMGELLDALLDISQLDSGSITPTKKDFAVQIMLDQIVANNEPSANEKGLQLRCAESSCLIRSDAALLQRVLENFVTNAIRYTESGYIEVRCIPRGDSLRIEVHDTGVGMPNAALETIFEEYFQIDNPVRDRSKGLGLGLAIVKHVARLLEHELDVTSVLGEGSTFAIEVPIGQPIEVAIVAAVKPTNRRSDRQPVVLLVDDDPSIVDATTMLLESAGIEVHSALDGEQAMAHIDAGVLPDMLISDYRLPGDSGIEVIRRVRRATTEDLPTILMTGDTSGKEIEAAHLTACAVLHKPVDTERLISLVEELSH